MIEPVSLANAYEAAHSTAVVVHHAERGMIHLAGNTRLDLINRMSTQAVGKLQSGEGAATVLTTNIGRIIDRPILYAASDNGYLLTGDAAYLQPFHDAVPQLDKTYDRMRELVAPAEAIFLDAKIESELVEMEAEEAREFLVEMGIAEPGLDTLARVGYETLGLQSYLTAGPKESRAWTIRKGATAPEAAGVIHTDFQKGFIKAEIVSYDDLVRLGGMQQAKAAGKVRLEGKDYVMADGDVVEFRFSS